jgi:hypothetical protein
MGLHQVEASFGWLRCGLLPASDLHIFCLVDIFLKKSFPANRVSHTTTQPTSFQTLSVNGQGVLLHITSMFQSTLKQ